MPEQTPVLREKAAEVVRLLVDKLSDLAAKGLEEVIRPELGRLLNNLANRLSELGRREEALQTAPQAAELYQQLARERPDVFCPR